MSALWNEIVRLVAEHPVAQGLGLVFSQISIYIAIARDFRRSAA